MMKKMNVALLTVVLSASAAGIASAQVKDAWVTAKTKIVLMTTDGLRTSSLNVDTVNGVVTLHGKVPTDTQREQAADAAKTVDGVKSVKNLLQVVPVSKEDMVDAADSVVKERIELAFKKNRSLAKSDVHVASVNKGVVLLSGDATDIVEHLRAIETTYLVKGVKRVSSEVKVKEMS